MRTKKNPKVVGPSAPREGYVTRPATNRDRRRAKRGKAELSPNELYVTEKEKKKKPNVISGMRRRKINTDQGGKRKRQGGRKLDRRVDSSCRKPGC